MKNKSTLLRLNLQKNWNTDVQKNNSGSSMDGLNYTTMTVLGYYDRLIYEPLNNWYAMRAGSKSHTDLSDEYKDEYTLRLVALQWMKSIISRGNYKFLDYSYFEDISNGFDNPIFATMLINCSDKFLTTEKPSVHSLFKTITEVTVKEVESQESNESLKIGIFLSLGYSEFAILFSDTSIKKINALIDGIRTKLFSEKSFAASTYSFIAFNECKVDKVAQKEEISATIDFSLAPGIRLEESDFADFFVEHDLKTISDNSDTNKEWENIKNELTTENCTDKPDIKKLLRFGFNCPVMLMGPLDWRWVIKKSDLKNFLNIYVYNKELSNRCKISCFSSCSKIFEEVQTKLMFERTDDRKGDQADDQEQALEPAEAESYCKKILNKSFNDFKTTCVNFIRTERIHKRSLHAMWDIKVLYDKITCSFYGGDIRRLTLQVFCDFLNDMTYCMQHNKSMKLGEVDKFLQEYIHEFRMVFEPYLFAIYRSDHAFFEGQTLSHPSIGSESKLLFCYNQVLYLWEREYLNIHPKTKTKFSYLVSSGGVDSTDNIDLFNLLLGSSENKSISRPIVVTMSEAGLYDFQGTLFKLAHEFFHKRGNRMRKLRVQCFIQDICKMIANELTTWFVDEELKIKVLRNLCRIKEPDKYKSILNSDEFNKWSDDIMPPKENSPWYLNQLVQDDQDLDKAKKMAQNEIFNILYSVSVRQKINEIINESVRNGEKWWGENLRSQSIRLLKYVWGLDNSKEWWQYDSSWATCAKNSGACDSDWFGYCKEWETYYIQDCNHNIKETIRGKIAHQLYILGKKFSDKVVFKRGNAHVKLLKIYFEMELDEENKVFDEHLYSFDKNENIYLQLNKRLNNVFATENGKCIWVTLSRECFADCLAVKAMVKNMDNDDDPWGKKNGLMSYLRAFLFECRNPKIIFSQSQMSPFWHDRMYIDKMLLGWNAVPKNGRVKTQLKKWNDNIQNQVVDEDYFNLISKILYNVSDDNNKVIEKMEGLISYLETCIKENEDLCAAIRKVHSSCLGKVNNWDPINIYSQFIFKTWLKIYSNS